MNKHFCNRGIEMVVACYPKRYKQQVNVPQVDFEISTEACESRWGATDGVNPIGGIWFTSDQASHIKALELLTIKHTLVNYKEMWKKCQHIRVKSENTTAIAYVKGCINGRYSLKLM